jgi:amino acid adenylation domain-containing protein
MPETERDGALLRLITEEALLPFDLEHGPLVRATLIKKSEQEHLLLLTMHHIISDGWSEDVLARELAALYESFSQGTGLPLEDLKIQYADYAVWQRRWLQGEVLERQLQYWKQQLAGAQTVLELPADKPRPLTQTFRGARYDFEIPENLRDSLQDGLRALSQSESATLFMTLLAAFSVLLSRYSGQAEVLVGTPIANRSRGELEGLIGFLSNTLVIRTQLDDNPSFRELVRNVRKVCLEAYAHQDVPFERLVEELEPERDLSRTPLFQTLFSLHRAKADAFASSGPILKQLRIDTGTSKVDLSLYMAESEHGLKGAFEYNTDLFEAATIERLSGHFLTLLQAVCTDPEQRISELPLLTDVEQRQLLVQLNATGREYPREQAIQQLFEQQATLTPDATALIFDAQRLTYRELNERANQLAHYLRAQGVSTETLVGLLMERSVELVVGLLGILKAGGAYVPLDVQHPRERLEFMLEDTQAAVLVTQQGLVEQLPEHRSRVVCLDTQWAEIASHSKENPKPGVTAENLAYVIYTSGSTGRPKGVAIEHRSALIFLHWAVEVFTPEQLAGVLASTSICFDLSVFEIFAPLSRGGKIILSENALALPSLPAANQVTLINTVPSAIAELSRMKGIPPSVQTVNLAGEALKNSLVQEVYQQQTIRQVFNLYGPSEDTTYSTYALIKKGPDEQVSIGRPVANTQVYLLDSHQQPVAQGMPGELFIGGAGLARGYLNRPELTAERFIPNPFSQQPGARLYRTGDLARYLPDGRIEYLGRSDHQVKLRGYRIELGEIEAVLAAHAGVREAVAIVRHAQGSDARLVAYLVAEQGHAVTGGQFRDYLKEKLPPYMIPSAFVMLPALPLTPNGKVNRAVLPEPDDVRPQLATDFVMPRTEAEAAVAQVWQEILNLDHVGVNDNFFDLGGHSLLMVQAHSKLREQFTTELTVIDLFKYPTVSTLAEFISKDAVTLTVTRPALEARQAEVEMPQPAIAHLDTAIAIIGMAGRFPGAKNLVEFWENLRQGVESISSFAGHELESPDLDPALLDDENFVRAGAVLDDVDLFDAPFFDFNPREAEITDPQQRLFLECAWEALEQSGYAAESYDGRIGVFAGIGMNGYLQNLYANPEVLRSTSAFQIAIGNDKDYLPTRLSYKLNLKGPSVNVQTACSTSLVAVHIACQSLLNRECEIALAGAISVRTPQKVGYYYQEGGINSPDGHCRAFDAQAQGTVPGNGGGIVVLKRLADARADGDVIHAVILGSMINNDGSAKVCYTAPSVEGQAEVVAGAQRAAGIEPDTITYIEAHGTGTPLGDPIELAALTQAFRSQTNRKAFCAVGSIKTNLGHLDAGAGMAGLIKTVLALKHRMIPPSLHFADPNPSSDLQNSPFYVNRMLREWITDGIPRRAGVSSFGIGGTNAHLILEEAPPRVAAQSSNGPHLLLLSAKTRSALDTMTVNLRDHLQQHDELDPGDVAYTLQVGRRGFNHRRMLVCPDAEDAVAQLSNPNANRMLTATVEPRHRPVVMMYPGQGAQYVNMAAGLYKWNAVFRKHVDVCAELLMPHLGLDLRRVLYPSDAELESAASQLNQTYLAQPALFVIEYALTQLWMELGVKPQAMIGHSIGEFVAACIAEVFTLEDALKLVAARGRLMQALPQGAMLIVPLPEQQVKQLLNAELSIAAVNGPSLCIVSGPTPAIDELERELNARGAEGQRLHTSHAFHSGMMEPAIKPFVELVKQIGLHPPKIPYISNVTGRWITAAQVMEPNYWGEHLRQTVRFADGLSELLKDPSTVVLEAGPGKGMSGLARQQMSQEGERIACSTLRAAKGREPDEASFLHAAGALWLAGIRLNWTGLYGDERPHRVALPTYPFERKRYWVEAATGKAPESPRRNESQELSLSNNLTPAPTETLAVTATERREPLAVQLEGPEFVAVPAPLEWREAVAQQHRHNGKRHGTVQRIITQQLQINARQLELMAQQLELLRNGKANNRKPTGPQSN